MKCLSNLKYIICYVIILVKFSNCNKIHKIFFYSENDLEMLFEKRLCISEAEVPDHEGYVKEDDPEISPMTLINDLAAYNKIDYQFFLLSEDGPSHNRWYTVALKLGNPEWDLHSEEYKGYGSKIKDAQKDAAKKAFSQTSFEHKPVIQNMDLNSDSDCDTEDRPSCRLRQIVNQTNRNMIYVKFKPHLSYLFGVQLYLDHKIFTAESHSLGAAKEEVAGKALEYLSDDDVDVCQADDIPENDDDIECTALKSPVSLLHEIAQKYQHQIKFNIIKEEGPAHKKIFTTVCKMNDFETVGEGSSMKHAKVKASEKMLEILNRLDYQLTFKTPKTWHKRSNKNNKLERLSPDPNIEKNPIKILYEWASANANGEEPVFLYKNVEDSEGNYKKFQADCIFKGLTASGLGHKKKIAKQNAALDMLDKLHIPYSEEIHFKDSLINRQYIPGLLKSRDYLHLAGISPENEEYENRLTRLEKLNKKLKRAADFFADRQKETPTIEDSVIAEIIEKNKVLPVKQLEDFLAKIKVKFQFINLPMNSNGSYSSVVWLYTKPELLCYGRAGNTQAEAQENSATSTLIFLSETSKEEEDITT